MTQDVVTVGPQTPLNGRRRLLVEREDLRRAGGRRRRRAPRCRVRGGHPLEGEERAAERSLGLALPSTHDHSKQEAGTAGEAMTTPAITIGQDAAVADAARVMIDRTSSGSSS